MEKSQIKRIKENMENIRKTFGTLKLKKPTQQLLDEAEDEFEED